MKAFSRDTVQGIIFDLDGTLYRMTWIMRPFLTFKVFPTCLRLPRFLKIRGTFAGIDLGSYQELMNRICIALSEKENCSAHEINAWITDIFYPAFVSSMQLFRNSRPGISELLTSLRSNGIRLGVLSDYALVEERLIGLGIPSSPFSTITSSEIAGALKPSARPFLDIASSWNLKPEQVLVVGDRDDTDGAASRRAGMQFLHISDKVHAPDTWSWDEVRTRLQSLS